MTGELCHELLYDARFDLAPPLEPGPGPEGHRAIFHVTGGRFDGPRLSGDFLPGGGDWARIRGDGSVAIDVRATARTDDGALIHITYQGRIVAPPALMPALLDLPNAHMVDPSLYYFRVLPLFETGSAAYAWLNHLCAVGVGRLGHGGVDYRVYRIL